MDPTGINASEKENDDPFNVFWGGNTSENTLSPKQ